MARVCLARSLAERGLFDEGVEHGREAIRMSEALDHPFSLIWACLGLGHLEGIRGDVAQAVGLVERAVALGRDWNITTYAPIAFAALGHMHARSGRSEEGLSWLEQAKTASEATRTGFFQSMGVVQLGEAHLLADQHEEARTAAHRALMLARQRGERGAEAWALRLCGEIADGAPAQEQYDAAMVLASELGMRPLVAHCHLGLAKLHRRTGQREQAQENFRAAATMYREMGMHPWLLEAEVAMS